MELKDIILPIGILVVIAVLLGVVTLTLTWNVNDKVTKLSDMNNSVIDLTGKVAVLTASNLQSNIDYNNLFADYNTKVSTLTLAQGQVAALTDLNNTHTTTIITLKSDNNQLRFDNNRLVFDNSFVTQLRTDNNKLVFDNNKLKLDYNTLSIDRNQLYFLNNDYNARAHRLYTALHNCYLAVKNGSGSTSPLIVDFNAILIINACVSTIDANVGDYNYFS